MITLKIPPHIPNFQLQSGLLLAVGCEIIFVILGTFLKHILRDAAPPALNVKMFSSVPPENER